MDETDAVMQGLDRIDRLEQGGAPAADLLVEVRRLLRTAERWAGGERDIDLDSALERCREALAHGELDTATSRPSRPARAAVDTSP